MNKKKNTILVCDDDREIVDAIEIYLSGGVPDFEGLRRGAGGGNAGAGGCAAAAD